MKSFFNTIWLRSALVASSFLVLLTAVVWAQEPATKETTTHQDQASVQTEVRNGEVTYVSGNDLVVKMENGSIQHFVVPDQAKFTVDGQDLTVHDLKPGMHLTQTITTTTTPTTVREVETIQGTVWSANPPKSVILTLPSGENKQYTIPENTKFNINGEDKTVFDLKKGMVVSATVIRDTPEMVSTRETAVTGTAPPPPAATPEAAPPPPPAETAATTPPPPQEAPAPAPKEEKAAKLPATASPLPLMGLIGIASLLGGWIGALRRR